MRILIFILLASLVLSDWSSPTTIFKLDESASISMSNVYRDAGSELNHVLVTESNQATYWYFAVKDSGSVVYKTTFKQNYLHPRSSIVKGAGDGKYLFIALGTELVNSYQDYAIMFTESHDGGKTWSTLVSLSLPDPYRVLKDAIYVKETGRIFIFYINRSTLEASMITRAPGSITFSQEMKICPGFSDRMEALKATYQTVNGKQLLHVFGKNKAGDIFYTQSDNNGISWLPVTVLVKDAKEIETNAISAYAISDSIFLTYSTKTESGKLLMSKDYGKTFTNTLKLTQGNTYTSNSIAVCGTKTTPYLIPLYHVGRNDSKPATEYSYIDLNTMKQVSKSVSFKEQYIRYLGQDCTYDASSSKMKVGTFLYVRPDYWAYLVFAVDSTTVPKFTED